MTYTLDFGLTLGTGKAGLTDLRAQLVDTMGAAVGSAIATGFAEVGSGCYLWHYASIPDAHRGGVAIYSAATPATILAFGAINPEEAERVDAVLAAIADVPTVAEFEARTLPSADYTVVSDLPAAPDNAGIAAILEDTGTTLPAMLAPLGPGVGAHSLVYTLTDSVTLLPMADVLVEISTDAAKDNVIRAGRTDSFGVVIFYLSAAGTYYVWRKKDGYSFADPDTEIVT